MVSVLADNLGVTVSLADVSGASPAWLVLSGLAGLFVGHRRTERSRRSGPNSSKAV